MMLMSGVKAAGQRSMRVSASNHADPPFANLPSPGCPAPFYPPLDGMCLSGGDKLGWAACDKGFKECLTWAQNECSVGDVFTGQACAGFWFIYITVPPGWGSWSGKKAYVGTGNIIFHPIPFGDGSQC